MTAADFAAELQNDPDFAARKRQLDEKRQGEIQHHRSTVQPVLDELRQAGFDVASLDELRDSGVAYRAAIPVLLKWLPLISDPEVKESIVRTLSVPWAKPTAALPLIAEFLTACQKDSGLKWAIGNALAVVADQSLFEQLCELVRDRRHGTARQMIVLALGKMKNPQAIDALIELLDDEDVSGHALRLSAEA